MNHPEVERTHSAAGPCVLVPHILKDSGVIAGFSCRGGGVSGDPYQSLNVGLHVGDRPDAVIENRRRLCVALGVRLAQWVGLEQVHGNRVAVVGRKHRGKGSVSLRNALPGVDAAITNVSGLVLAVLAADCVPLLFYDPVARAVGVAHAGWKGTLSGISRRVVEGMAREYGSCPEHIRVVLGPSIGPCCYEIDERVFQPYQVAFRSRSEELLRADGDGRWRLDLWQANRIQLLDAGCDPRHVRLTNLCTSCHPDLFFSHRRDHGRTGRLAGLISLSMEAGN